MNLHENYGIHCQLRNPANIYEPLPNTYTYACAVRNVHFLTVDVQKSVTLVGRYHCHCSIQMNDMITSTFNFHRSPIVANTDTRKKMKQYSRKLEKISIEGLLKFANFMESQPNSGFLLHSLKKPTAQQELTKMCTSVDTVSLHPPLLG